MIRPSLTALQTFLAIARHGSLKGAAESLHKTQSAVSHQLRQLETTLGTALTTREGRSIRLTSVGQTLAKGLETGFSEIERTLEQAVTLKQPEVLHINCLPSVAVRWLIPRLSGFRARFPDYRIDFRYSGALETGIPPDADIKITWHDGPPGIDSGRARLFSGATWPVASPLYLQNVSPNITPGALPRMEILHDEFLEPWYNWFRQHGLSTRRLDEGVIYQDFNLLSTAAVAGQGIALCPPRLIERELSDGTLVTLFDTPGNQDRAYWVFYRHGSRAAVMDFVHWLIDEARLNPDHSPETAIPTTDDGPEA